MRLVTYRLPKSEFLLAREGVLGIDPTRWVCRYRERHGLGKRKVFLKSFTMQFYQATCFEIGIVPGMRPESRRFMASRHNRILRGFPRQAQNMRVVWRNVSYLPHIGVHLNWWRVFNCRGSCCWFFSALSTTCTSLCPQTVMSGPGAMPAMPPPDMSNVDPGLQPALITLLYLWPGLALAILVVRFWRKWKDNLLGGGEKCSSLPNVQ